MPNIDDLTSPLFVVPTPKTRSYRAFLVDLGQKLKEDDLTKLKFVLKDDIPEGELEKLCLPLQVFSALENRCLLGPSKLEALRECLEAIDRPNLIEMLDEYADAGSKFPLKPRVNNFLEKDGYRVSIKGGRHFDTSQGEFVEVRSGSNYSLTLVNQNNHRCLVNILIDGYEMFPARILLPPKQTCTIERPERLAKKFKFFAISDAPAGSGINKWRKGENGLIQIKFSPEITNMKITCVASGAGSQIISCSMHVTDVEFREMVSKAFGDAVATIMVNPWKPLGNRGAKLAEYGIYDGSRVDVNLGGVGGVSFEGLGLGIKKNVYSERNIIKWRAGATTLEGKSNQTFSDGDAFPTDPCQVTILSLRLVARENEIPIPSTGDPTHLTKATLIPPPVPN